MISPSRCSLVDLPFKISGSHIALARFLLDFSGKLQKNETMIYNIFEIHICCIRVPLQMASNYWSTVAS